MRARFLAYMLVPVFALAFFFGVQSQAPAADPKPIKIGLLYSLSGMAAVYTKGTVIGHQIAAEEIKPPAACWAAARSNTSSATTS